MSAQSPLLPSHQETEAEFLPYGPTDAGVLLVASFGEPELEYAAIRKTAALIDMPHRGTLRITGSERIAFLNSMLTQELADVQPGQARQSFWLNRQGRIDADLNLLHFEDETIVDLDIHQAADTARSLEEFLFSEDVQIEDLSEPRHHLSLHGPQAALRLSQLTDGGESSTEAEKILGMRPLTSARIVLHEIEVIVFREDITAAPGFHLSLNKDDAIGLYEALIDAGTATEEEQTLGLRRLGWSALNVARIEAGTPIMNLDFGTGNLPHETGLLRQRVSFTKGCYLGQEIVARMESQGRPKQMLVGLKVRGEQLPVTGAHVSNPDDADAIIGAVTSSAMSPLLSSTPIAFAMLKSDWAEVGLEVQVQAEGKEVDAVVQGLCFTTPSTI